MKKIYKVNFLVDRLGPNQTHLNMLRELTKLSLPFSPYVYCTGSPKPPIDTPIPILALHYALNHRDNEDSIFISTSFRHVDALRNIKCAHKVIWVDCPEWLYPRYRTMYTRIAQAYASEYPVVTSCPHYSQILGFTGSRISDILIPDFDSVQMTKFLESMVGESQ